MVAPCENGFTEQLSQRAGGSKENLRESAADDFRHFRIISMKFFLQ